MQSLISLAGMATLLALAVLMSEDRRRIRIRTVGIALGLQIAIAGLVIYFPPGRAALAGLVGGVQRVIDYGNEGIEFVFGARTTESLGFTIAVNVLPVIVFFSALMSLLYYLGIMQRVVFLLGGWLQRLLGTTRTESMSAVSNIFVGHTEAPLVVKPYLAGMSRSELFAVMTGGCATIAGAVMAAYASMGVDLNYLITASFMAAPGGLAMAKIVMPEARVRESEIAVGPTDEEERPVNVFEAIGNGALLGLKLALNVGAMLLAFVAMIALLNGIIGGVASLAGYEGLTLQQILGWLFAPIAFLLGIPWTEALTAGSLIGQKLIINEFYAYANFVQIEEGLSAHSRTVVTFALCGFANLTSIAILLGGLGSIVPSRRHDIARLGLKAVLTATLANLMSAALAGLFHSLGT
ncbi:MAG: NupC/NupG family nucleoside CNT transporter [Gammaproteobacteria bacterium]|jgi:CNT family concentrative nucleoside transporter